MIKSDSTDELAIASDDSAHSSRKVRSNVVGEDSSSSEHSHFNQNLQENVSSDLNSSQSSERLDTNPGHYPMKISMSDYTGNSGQFYFHKADPNLMRSHLHAFPDSSSLVDYLIGGGRKMERAEGDKMREQLSCVEVINKSLRGQIIKSHQSRNSFMGATGSFKRQMDSSEEAVNSVPNKIEHLQSTPPLTSLRDDEDQLQLIRSEYRKVN